MSTNTLVFWLTVVTAVGALVAAAAGLFVPAGNGPLAFVTVHGETVQLYGQGVYAYDSLIEGAGRRGVDLVTLVVAIPILAFALQLYRRGNPQAQLLLPGILTYFLYVYGTLTIGAAYNDLFLLYALVFGASFYAFALTLAGIDQRLLDTLARAPLRHGRIGGFLVACGLITAVVWLEAPVSGLIEGRVPDLVGHNTTLVIHGLDLAITVPALLAAGLLIRRGNPAGYRLAVPLLSLVAMLAPAVVAMTASQLLSGVVLTPAEAAAFVLPFVVLGLIALWILATLRRHLPDLRAVDSDPGHEHRQ